LDEVFERATYEEFVRVYQDLKSKGMREEALKLAHLLALAKLFGVRQKGSGKSPDSG